MESQTPSKPTARLRKSCELCREVKGRCVPSQDSTRCLRCVRDRKQCVFLEAKARLIRGKQSKSRVAEMEEKIEGILARLSANDDVAGRLSASELVAQISSDPSRASDLPMGNTTFQIPFKLPSFQFTNVVFDGFQDAVSKGYVSSEQAEASLRIFQTQACNFPFVIVDPTLGLDILRRKRPFLLLSILTFAAQSNVSLQAKLETELKESLCRRVIMDGEKSLDLIQGLLVYVNCIFSALRKPTNLLYSTYIGGCGELLAGIAAAKSDALLPYFIRLQRLQEEINQAFQYDKANEQHEMDAGKIQTLCHRFEQELEQARLAFQPEIWNSAKLVSSYYALKIYAREIGFHSTPSATFGFGSADEVQSSWYSSPAQHNSLLGCLEATTEYLNHFLSLSSGEVLSFTIPDLLRLLYAVLILCRFSNGLDAPLLDATLLRARTYLKYYLDALVEKIRNIVDDIHNQHDHYLMYLCRMFEDSRKWYRPALAGTTAISEDLFSSRPLRLTKKAAPAATGYCLDPDGQEKCPDFESAWDNPIDSSDPADLFMNWEDTAA